MKENGRRKVVGSIKRLEKGRKSTGIEKRKTEGNRMENGKRKVNIRRKS